jgi:hypothetical protein
VVLRLAQGKTEVKAASPPMQLRGVHLPITTHEVGFANFEAIPVSMQPTSVSSPRHLLQLGLQKPTTLVCLLCTCTSLGGIFIIHYCTNPSARYVYIRLLLKIRRHGYISWLLEPQRLLSLT